MVRNSVTLLQFIEKQDYQVKRRKWVKLGKKRKKLILTTSIDSYSVCTFILLNLS